MSDNVADSSYERLCHILVANFTVAYAAIDFQTFVRHNFQFRGYEMIIMMIR